MWSFPYFLPPTPSSLMSFLSNPLLEKTLLANSPYQAQYLKNLGLLKSRYQKIVPKDISFVEIQSFILRSNETRRFFYFNVFGIHILVRRSSMIEIHCFLSALAFYEVNSQKPLQSFV